MTLLARVIALVLLAVFAASTIAHETSATSMSFAMSHAAMAGADMGDCDSCPPRDDGKAPFCGQACLAPFAAIPAAVGVELPSMAAGVAASPLHGIVGRTGPPEPHPPQTIIP